jgi:hypothetical protein
MMNHDHHITAYEAVTLPALARCARLPRRKLEVAKTQDCCSGSEAKRRKKERKKAR